MVFENDNSSGYASPPCMAHELVSSRHGHVTVDAQTAIDVARWRRAQRQSLIERRMAMSVALRRQMSEALSNRLHGLFASECQGVLGLYWPIRGEPNLRGWMQQVVAGGLRVALPEVVARDSALVFREWLPGCRMQPGVWKIPVPVDGAQLRPSHVIAPLVGFDESGYRLGYGGGYYDRTLAQLAATAEPPQCIGVGWSMARLPTIFPQPHDMPMHLILTETDLIEPVRT